MSDHIARLLTQIQGWAASIEAHHATVMEMLALERAGHPRAQDFEPTGHGGSDPTALGGTTPDNAVLEGKRYVAAIERAWKAAREADDISHRHRYAVRPERKADDLDDFWCVLHAKHNATEPRYRGLLCRPCYERQGDKRRKGLGELTDDEVKYHATYDRWPRTRYDPTSTRARVDVMRIAGVDRLQLHATAMSAEQAAATLLEA